MLPRESGRVYRTTQQDVSPHTPSLLIVIPPDTSQASNRLMGIADETTPNVGGVLSEHPCPTGLTLKELEALIPHEYGPLTSWTALKLFCEYGVIDLPHPDRPGQQLKIVDPIAEELVHDTIVLLWEKAKGEKVVLNDTSHVRRWLKGALKIALRQWTQQGAREYERRAYAVAIEDEEQDPVCPEVIELWDVQNHGSFWRTVEEGPNRVDIHGSSAHSAHEKAVRDELTAALKRLPRDIWNVVYRVFVDDVSWLEVSASLNVDRPTLEREVQRRLRTLKPYIPSYQPSHQPVRRDTRRARKSFHCPLCETVVQRKPKSFGLVCTGCGVGIPKDQFAIRYFYRHV